jgi:hypothetical protein
MKTKVSPPRIDQKVFDCLKSREKAYLIMLYQRKYSERQIKAKLFIDCEKTFARLKAKMSKLIKGHYVQK